MSGICGVLALDGSDVSQTDLDAMLNRLARRGPDGTHRWLERSVALGHALLATTPEALVEVLPLTDPESACTITADCRIDNREEVIAELGLEGSGRVIGDGELILRAYLQWGEHCPGKLLGDFAFAIWDPRSQRLFCARDHMGMRQLHFHHRPDGIFVFATEEQALLEHPLVPVAVNEARVADFLDQMEGMDFTSTFFEGILRLPPAHRLSVSADGLSLQRYWTLELPPVLRLPSDEAYAQAFLDVFSTAVHCRLRSAGPVGSMVSGGVDSNAVAAIAARQLAAEGRGPLRTISAVGPDPDSCQETQCIRDSLANPRFEATITDHSQLGGESATLARLIEDVANPFDASMLMISAVYLLAHQQQVKVVLDGATGDLMLASGNRVAQLMNQGRVREAFVEAQTDARRWGFVGLWRTLIGSAWLAFVPRQVRAVRQRIAGRAGDLAAVIKPRVSRRLARRVRLARRRDTFRRYIGVYHPAAREYRLAQIGHPHTTAARERYDRVASVLAVEPRDPFLDVRVIRFCLSLPPSQLKSGGWPKLILRRALEGLVPGTILWRQGKTHLGLHFMRELLRESNAWHARWPEMAARLRPYVPRARLRRANRRKLKQIVDSGTFIELFALGSWLVRIDRR